MNRRRGHLEGSIQTIRDGNKKVLGYRPHITIPGEGRKSLRRVKTKKEAQKLLDEAKVSLSQGHLSAAPSQTLAKYVEGILPTVAAATKPSAYAAFRLNIGRLLPLLGHLRLDKLRPAHVQGAYNRLLADGRSPRTVRHSHAALHKALNDAVRLGLIGRNVSDFIELPKLPHSEMQWYSPAELEQLFQATVDQRLHALWVTLGTTGLRLGEGLGLKWSDLDLRKGTLRVNRTLSRDRSGGGFRFDDPKTARSRRTVELTATAITALKAHRERQGFEARRLGELWAEQDLVFPSEVGTPLEQSRVHRHWTKAAKEAGVPRHRVHDLRHSFATALLMAGVPIGTVSAMLGHASEAFTLTVYGHVTPQSQRDAAAMMEALLGQARSGQ